MNLLVLEASDFVSDRCVSLVGRRAEHIRKILRASVGDEVRVGVVNGSVGVGRVTRLGPGAASLEIELNPDLPLPPASPVTLAFAACRPPTLAKVLSQATAMGVKQFEVFHCRRVEKSYWDARAFEPEALRKELLLGLEQCIDTRLPTVRLHRRFRPFAEDLLGIDTPARVRVADPSAGPQLAGPVSGPQTLVLGPEGGFVEFELERFRDRAFEFIGMGPRILRVETAAVALLGQQALAPDGDLA